MRPTLDQIYRDPRAIIDALEAQGAEAAHARVMSMMRWLVELQTLYRLRDRLRVERTQEHQYDPKISSGDRDRKRIVERHKEIGQVDRTLQPCINMISGIERRLEGKVSRWPDLDLDPDSLRRRADHHMVDRLIKRQGRRGRRHDISG